MRLSLVTRAMMRRAVWAAVLSCIPVTAGCSREKTPVLDNITLTGVRVRMGEPVPAAAQLHRDTSRAQTILDGSHRTETYISNSDSRVKIVIQDGRVIVIMLASHQDDYLPIKGVVPGVPIEQVRHKIHGAAEGRFGQAPALVSTNKSSSTYFVRDYDDTKPVCETVDKVGVVVLLAKGSDPGLAPESASAFCSSRD